MFQTDQKHPFQCLLKAQEKGQLELNGRRRRMTED